MKVFTDPGRVLAVRNYDGGDGAPLHYKDGSPVRFALVMFPDETELRQLTLDRNGEWDLAEGASYRFELLVTTDHVNGASRPVKRTKLRALRAAQVPTE